ncbi:MAG: HprK-related kinase A, partial [Alphaproteobacteria bacterium]
MVQIATIDRRTLIKRLAGQGLVLPVGPFAMWLGSHVAAFADDLIQVYAPYEAFVPDEAIADFGVDIAYTAFWRRFFRPSVAAYCDIASPFVPLPVDLAFVGAEMAANWQITMGVNSHLLIHGAVVADSQDRAIVMPGASGSGKSTLAALLAHDGWRLLADEFVLIDLASGLAVPYPRPVSLKNEAIAAMRAFAPKARLSRAFAGTLKGTIAYLTPPDSSLEAMHRPAQVHLVLFPQFRLGETPAQEHLDAGELLMRLIAASANYSRLGAAGFDCATALAARVPALRMRFGTTAGGLGLAHDLASRYFAAAPGG